MKETAKVFKALANERRLKILKLLKDKKEMSVGDIAEQIRLSFKSTSRHIQLLYSAGLVLREQRGLEAYYQLNTKNPFLISNQTLIG